MIPKSDQGFVEWVMNLMFDFYKVGGVLLTPRYATLATAEASLHNSQPHILSAYRQASERFQEVLSLVTEVYPKHGSSLEPDIAGIDEVAEASREVLKEMEDLSSRRMVDN